MSVVICAHCSINNLIICMIVPPNQFSPNLQPNSSRKVQNSWIQFSLQKYYGWIRSQQTVICYLSECAAAKAILKLNSG